jgi:hypothetical protein
MNCHFINLPTLRTTDFCLYIFVIPHYLFMHIHNFPCYCYEWADFDYSYINCCNLLYLLYLSFSLSLCISLIHFCSLFIYYFAHFAFACSLLLPFISLSFSALLHFTDTHFCPLECLQQRWQAC